MITTLLREVESIFGLDFDEDVEMEGAGSGSTVQEAQAAQLTERFEKYFVELAGNVCARLDAALFESSCVNSYPALREDSPFISRLEISPPIVASMDLWGLSFEVSLVRGLLSDEMVRAAHVRLELRFDGEETQRTFKLLCDRFPDEVAELLTGGAASVSIGRSPITAENDEDGEEVEAIAPARQLIAYFNEPEYADSLSVFTVLTSETSTHRAMCALASLAVLYDATQRILCEETSTSTLPRNLRQFRRLKG